MAKCTYCNQLMTAGVVCTFGAYDFYDGQTLDRIPYNGDILGKHCPDCGVPNQSLHHPGCDLEICPRCEGQSISCRCDGEDALAFALRVKKEFEKEKNQRITLEKRVEDNAVATLQIAGTLLNAGYTGKGTVDGVAWLASELDGMREAWAVAKDSVALEQYGLAKAGLTSDQINAVLVIMDGAGNFADSGHVSKQLQDMPECKQQHLKKYDLVAPPYCEACHGRCLDEADNVCRMCHGTGIQI